jgi:hypothetical protein
MEIHELCYLFPEMADDELAAFSADVAKNGLIDPIIWTHDGRIIDGRHRHRVCCVLGITPEYREWNGESGSLLRFVVSRNLHRRNLAPGQRAALAAEIKPMIEAEIREELREKQREAARETNRKRREGNGAVSPNLGGDRPARNESAREAARVAGVSHSYVSDAERIRDASPETFDEVKAGAITIPEAKRRLAGEADGPQPEDHKHNFIKVSLDPLDAARTLRRHFQGERWAALIEAMS